MRIALVHNLPSGGAKRVAYEHTRRLVARGHIVDAFELSTADSDFCDLAPVATETALIDYRWDQPYAGGGWQAALRTPLSLATLRNNHQRLADTYAALARRLDTAAYDVIYVHHDRFETAPSLLRFARTPTAYFCQEPSRALFESPLVGSLTPNQQTARSLWWSPLRERPNRYWVRQAALATEQLNTRCATLVLANSRYSAESILRAVGRSARYCPLGVDAEAFVPGDLSAEPYLLSVGGVAAVKGHAFVVRALSLLPAEVRPPLTVVADRAEPAALAELQVEATERGVTLRYEQRIADQLLVTRYQQATALAYAPFLEPFGLAVLEAAACGTPTVAVAEGGPRESVVDGQTGLLTERDEAAFAAAVARLLDGPDLRARLGAAARQYAETWSWERSVDRLLDLFEETIQSAGRR